jgi:formylglycine-generating enzyme required for sulfatase activity
MSAAVETYRDEMEATYAVDFTRNREPIKARKRFPEYRRSGGAPTRVSGMHCRRNKRWTWGSGRGARVQNLRAFAGALALLVASVASNAFAVSLTLVPIGNPGNPGNVSSNPSGLGSVATSFWMSATETTNTQYVEFLNTVDPNGTNVPGIYNINMTTNSFGGIDYNMMAPVGSKYSVKPGTASNGASFANMPVNFVSWFSAARFVNWLENGQTSNPADLETGTYNLANATSGPIVARNPGATYFLPSIDEWYKAAFYNGSTYTTYQTNSNVAPTATLVTSTPNAGNFGNSLAGPIDVGSYTNSSTSSYGLYDMLGNVTELTDSSTLGQYRAVGGGYAAILSAWDANAAGIFKNGNFVNVNYGFRVAAVPEPGTIALAGAGLAGLAGIEWKRRRKMKATAVVA